MKVIAAAAIADNLDYNSVMTAGFFAGLIVFILGVTNTIQVV